MSVYGHGSGDPDNIKKYDHLPAEQAIIRAWTEGEPSPRWHALAIRDVHNAMPLLARAVDRLVAKFDTLEDRQNLLDYQEKQLKARYQALNEMMRLSEHERRQVADCLGDGNIALDEGQLITDAINSDPDEIARLIKAREQARSGQTIRAHRVWEYIESFLSNPSTGVKRSRPGSTDQPEPSDPPVSPQS